MLCVFVFCLCLCGVFVLLFYEFVFNGFWFKLCLGFCLFFLMFRVSSFCFGSYVFVCVCLFLRVFMCYVLLLCVFRLLVVFCSVFVFGA